MTKLKRIAVICAYPTGLNPGMTSVDIAAVEIIKFIQKKNNIEALFFTTEGNIKVKVDQNTWITYRLLSKPEQLDKFDLILFWGDFSHWIKYADSEWSNRQLNPSLRINKSIDNWYNLYFFCRRGDLKPKTITYGESLYGISGSQLINSRYIKELIDFYGKSAYCTFRDIYSVNFINQILGRQKATLGVDCSLFGERKITTTQAKDRTSIAIDFSRSDANLALNSISSAFANKNNLEISEIHWLNPKISLEDKLASLESADMIFTDVYHCALNAIKRSKRVICFGRGSAQVKNTLSDKKKEIFFSQHFMQENYFYIEDVFESLETNSKTNSLIRRLNEAANNDNRFHATYGMLQSQIKRSEALLIRQIKSVLNLN